MGASAGAPVPGGALRVGLVGCVKQKRSSPAQAADLYTSALFLGRRRWVEQTCGRWFILSAKHGLVRPDALLAPYDETLTGAGVNACRRWSGQVLSQLRAELGDLTGIVFEIHAGAAYRDNGLITGLMQAGAMVEVPAAGLSQGRQLALYKAGPGASVPPSVAAVPPLRKAAHAPPVAPAARPVGPSSTYHPLAAYLTPIGGTRTTLSFHEMATIVGRDLPASAHKHRAWWANDASHSQARGWLAAGWRVASVDQTGGTVTFERG